MSNVFKIKIDIIKDNQKTFQILEQPEIRFTTFFDKETGVTIDSVNCPEFYCGSYSISKDFALFLRGNSSEDDFRTLRFDFDETDMEKLIKALTKFCEKMGWNLKLTGSYFNEIVLGEL